MQVYLHQSCSYKLRLSGDEAHFWSYKTCLLHYANYKGADQLQRLISVFKLAPSLVSKSKFQTSLAVQPGYSDLVGNSEDRFFCDEAQRKFYCLYNEEAVLHSL